MNYQVLARKWRPRFFKEMVGQSHVLQALINALDQNRLHHAYLFTGTRGVGKTTIARILAKCLNCEQGVSSEPCGECSACQQVDAGNFIDLIEVDAASRTRVEDTRELLDNVQYAPSCGRYKVYLIDEVHMLSSHSFNALLKTLEEPPPHVKFLLATTDPQKLPVTVLSRCLQFNLMAIPPERIAGHLKEVLVKENVSFDEAALWELAKAADGSMRDALSLTDQGIAYGNGHLLAEEIRTMLGTVDRSGVLKLLRCLADENAEAMLECVAELAEKGPDYNDILAELIDMLHHIAVSQAIPDFVLSEFSGSAEENAIKALAAQLSAEDVQLCYQIALMGRRDMSLVSSQRNGLEMILLRMLLFRPRPVDEKGGGSGSSSGSKSKAGIGLGSSQGSASGLKTARESIGKLQGKSNAEPVAVHAGASPANLPQIVKQAKPNVSSKLSNIAVETEQSGGSPVNNEQAATEMRVSVPTDWDKLILQLNLSGVVLNLAKNCVLVKHTEQHYFLMVNKRHAILLQPAHQARLQQALTDYLGHVVQVKIELGESELNTPQQLDDLNKAQCQQMAEQSIMADPVVQGLLKDFDARIEPGSIKPRITH